MGNGRRRVRAGRLHRTVLLAVVLAATVTTRGSAPAAAQPAPPTVTVDPATDLRHGDTVEVTAAGFSGFGVMGIFQCPTAAAQPASSECEMLYIALSPPEPLVVDLTIREVLRTSSPTGPRYHRCGATPGDCSLMAWAPGGPPDVHALAPLDITQGPLAFGQGQYEEESPVQAYVVAPPADGAQLAQCARPVTPTTLADNRCTTPEPVALDPDGRAEVPFTVRLVIPDPGGDVDCGSQNCDLTLFDGDGDLLRTLPVTVTRDDGPPTLAVEPAVELQEHQPVTVQVRGARNEGVVVAQCDASVTSAAEVTDGPCGAPRIEEPPGDNSGFDRRLGVEATLAAVDGSTVDCTVAIGACVFALASDSGNFTSVPISFAMPDEVAIAPAAGLVDREEITLTATGLTPGTSYRVTHCDGVDEAPDATWSWEAFQVCTPDTDADPLVEAGPDGTLTTTAPALQRFTDLTGRAVTCRAQCQLAVVAVVPGGGDYSVARYAMATGTVTATPSSGLHDGQVVDLTGTDILASYEGATVLWLTTGRWGIGQCRGAVRDDPTLLGILEHCTVPASGTALDVPGSTFDVPVTVAAEFIAALGDPVDCRAPGTDCVLVTARLEDDFTTTLHSTTPLTFTP